MSLVLGLLLVIISLSGAFVVVVMVLKLRDELPERAWEYITAVLVGVGLLVWPVARQASLSNTEKKLEQYRQILELEDLGQYRLVHARTGETLNIVVDDSGEVQLNGAQAASPPPPAERETETPVEGSRPTEEEQPEDPSAATAE